MNELPKRCGRVQDLLSASGAGELGRVRSRLMARHLSACELCAAEEAAQRDVAAGFAQLGEGTERRLAAVAPPEDLLASLLEQVDKPGLRDRAAVPVRGAVSGARPALSVALLALILALCALAGWAGWRLATRAGGRLSRDS